MSGRVIKFRAWDGEKMRDDIRISNDGFAYDLDIGKERSWPLMQFTGLHDRNGKEIYEGDVVRVAPAQGLYTGLMEVFWNEDGCWEPFVYPNDPTCGYKDHRGAEVIGNIYENPELLESKAP